MTPYLRVTDLSVSFSTPDGVVRAVDGLSFGVERGRTLGIVGESGSGKSVTSLAVMGLHDPRRTRITGSVRVGDRELVGLSQEAVRRLRGREIAMIFQDPLSALHPYYTVGRQITEAYRVHHRVSARVARARAVEMLGLVGVPVPARRVDDYPHQFSGGMRQRVMIAMALVNDPALLIADEPTTALDVTVQAQILDLLVRLQKEFHSAVVLITHDLGVVSRVADDILVMYGGRSVEFGTADQVLTAPRHPYTWGLLGSVPSLRGDPDTDLAPIPGNPPSLIDIPGGCAFHPRCRYALPECRSLRPEPLPVTGPAELTEPAGPTGSPGPTGAAPTGTPGHRVACHLPEAERVRAGDAAAGGQEAR